MAVDYCSYNQNEHKMEEDDEDEEEEYIDMEVSSLTHLFSLSNKSPSPQHPREFEFQMSSTMNVERDTTTSPADELFYMGKLLPLHLPPRLQMVEKLLQDSTPNKFNIAELYSTPLGTPTTSTPFESCNVSPAESCQVSRELNPQEYFCVYANQDYQKVFMGDNHHARRSWTKKLKTKIKSLFRKSDEQSPSSAVKNKQDQGLNSKEDNLEKKVKEIPQAVSRERFERQNDANNETKICHRRSFSGAFKRRSSTTMKLTPSSSSVSSSSSSSSSSSTSSNSNGLNDFPLLKRSSSANSEMETSLIQGAIAHCKQSSQQTIQGRKTFSEVGSQSLPSSRFAAALDDQTTLCRG